MKNIYIIIGALTLMSGLGLITFNEEVFSPGKEAGALLTKGKLLLEQDREETMKKAIEIFTTVASHFPGTDQAEEALYYLAESYEKLGNVDVAIEKYRKLLGLELDKELSERVRFKIARLQLTRYNTEEGFNGLMVLLTDTVDDVLRSDIYTEIARYYAREKGYAQSGKNYEIALSENPRNKEANMELARMLFLQGRDDEAFLQYRKFFNIYVDRNRNEQGFVAKYINEVYQTAIDTFNAGRHDAALKYFNFLSTEFAYTRVAEESIYYTGNIYFIRKDYNKAIGHFKEVISKRPEFRDENAYIRMGQAYHKKRDYENAIATFAKVQTLYPKGKYVEVARKWEKESKSLLRDRIELESSVKEVDTPEEKQSSLPSRELPGDLNMEPTLDDDVITP